MNHDYDLLLRAAAESCPGSRSFAHGELSLRGFAEQLCWSPERAVAAAWNLARRMPSRVNVGLGDGLDDITIDCCSRP